MTAASSSVQITTEMGVLPGRRGTLPVTSRAAAVTLRNRYFYLMPPVSEPVPWNPPEVAPDMQDDAIYFGQVLAEMDRRVRRDDLTVYLTQNLEELPSYGPDVVAVVIADEKAHVPAYIDRVAAVFKNNAVRPLLTTSFLREPELINVWWFVSYLRLWYHHAPGALRWLGDRARGRARPMWLLPVGTFNQIELPIKDIAERGTDLYFAGSVSHQGRPSFKERISPKVTSRNEMVEHAQRLAAAHPELNVEVVDTGAFRLSIGQSGEEYSHALMDAKIALVPRGVIADTFRFWQAVRYGCVVVTDTIPRHKWLYDGAPIVKVRRWHELEDVALELLADEARLRDLHERSLEWWRSRAAPEVVGAHMAQRLDALPR